VIVVDTSAWVEFLRRTDSPACRTLRRLLGQGADLAVTEVVVAEVLMGARSPDDARRLRLGLLALPVLPLGGLAGFEAAAALYVSCRRGGDVLRGLLDCLVAVPVIRAGATLLHSDRDFEKLARHAPLVLEPVS